MKAPNRISRFLVFTVLFFVSQLVTSQVLSQAAQAQALSLEDFFRNPVATGFEISPDGKKVAYLKPWQNRLNIYVKDLATKEEKRLTQIVDRDVADYFWKGSENIFYLRDFGGDENFHLFRVNIKDNSEADLTPFTKTRVEIVDNLNHVSDRHLLLSHNKRDPKVFDVYKLDLKTNKMTLILQNPGDLEGFLTDNTGRLRLATRAVGTDTEILHRANDQAPFKVILKHDYNHFFTPTQFAKDNQSFYATSNLGRDTSALVLYDLKSQQETLILTQRSDYDADSYWGQALIYSNKKQRPLALNIITTKTEQVFFDPEFEKIYTELRQKLNDDSSQIIFTSKSDDETKFVFAITSDRSRGSFYLYDTNQKEPILLGESAPWLKKEDLAEMKPIEYFSRDGLKIHGYLTLPKNYKPGQKIGFIVNPHGGPWARDFWRFNSEVQFLANRGFGILQMNFRGSTGYGKKFLKASFKQWGQKMQDDVTDGTHWLVSSGYADPKKICIYGGSYGGYATLMGLVKEPDLYACGVDYVGVSNLFTFLKTIPPYWSNFMPKMYEWLGHPEKDKEMFEHNSPALQVHRIKSPLFIAQGAKDPRVNQDESDQMVKNLKSRGIEVPYLLKENEGHGFRNEENRMEFYREMEKFLNQHLK